MSAQKQVDIVIGALHYKRRQEAGGHLEVVERLLAARAYVNVVASI
jgi:hypothetical protein